MKFKPASMRLLHPLIRTVLIVLAALSGGAGTAADWTLNDSIALDSAGSWPKGKASSGRSTIDRASRVSVPNYREHPDPVDEFSSPVLPGAVGCAPAWYDDIRTQHTTFGAGSFALNALGCSASTERRHG